GGRAQREATRGSFDRVAALYEHARPGYPEELWSHLQAGPLRAGASVLEVGCGTGQATSSLAPRAGEVTCVELGPTLAARARANLAGFPNVTVVVGAFEDVELPAESFDLVFSATAWHWIDPRAGYPKAAGLLAFGGALVLATNAHVAGGTQSEIAGEMAALQHHLCPDVGAWQFPSVEAVTERALGGMTIAEVWARIDRSFEVPAPVHALFEEPSVTAFPWTAAYSARGYADMLLTHSPYLALDDEHRSRLAEGVAALVHERLGGQVTKDYLAMLAVSPRR
ncbi:MAG: class I SAM-dependent methyltransferase, partial [Acidimicrobiales bacterium]